MFIFLKETSLAVFLGKKFSLSPLSRMVCLKGYCVYMAECLSKKILGIIHTFVFLLRTRASGLRANSVLCVILQPS